MKKKVNTLSCVIRKFTIVALLVASSSMGRAVIIQTTDVAVSGFAAYPVSSTDLLQTSLSGATTSLPPYSGTSIASLYDGTAGSNVSASIGDTFIHDSPTNAGTMTLTFDLNTSVNTLGYNISSIATYAGWFGTRANQSYIVEFSLVGSASYNTLDTVNYLPIPNADGATNSTRVVISDSLFGSIASGVDSLRFTINTPGPGINSDTAYREFDIIGTATVVPEPTTYAMLGLAGVSLLILRRLKGVA
jgi:hypothetical protein